MKIMGKDGDRILVETRPEYGFIASMDERVRWGERFLLSLTNFGSMNFQRYDGSEEVLEEIMKFESLE